MRAVKLYMAMAVVFLISMVWPVHAEISLNTEGCTSGTFCMNLRGPITEQDVRQLRELKTIRQRSNPDSHVILNIDSGGGQVYPAMEAGRLLRQMRATVTMAVFQECKSACVFILAGAVQRAVGGEVGIHRPFSDRTGPVEPETVQREYNSLTSAAKNYLQEMNLPGSLYEAMIRVPPETIRVLSDAELAKYGLNTVDPVEQEVRDSENAKRYGLSKQEYLRRKALSEKTCLAALQKHNDMDRYFYCDQRVLITGE